MTTLSSTQEAILTEANTRSDGKVLPFPSSASHVRGGAATKVLTTLVEKGFIEEIAGEEGEKNYTITATGRDVIGVKPESEKTVIPEHEADEEASVTQKSSKPPSGKLGQIVDLMQRPEGATVQEMMDATGWQKHSARGAISGQLKKKRGYVIDKSMNGDGEIIYKIESEESVSNDDAAVS